MAGEGRIDLGFLRLPVSGSFDCTLLLEERILAIFPRDQASEKKRFPVEDLKNAPYILRPDSLDADTREIFRKTPCNPRITYSAKDDYAVMAMVERGLGMSILPELLLKRTPYKLAKRELDPPATRQIGVACKHPQSSPLLPVSFAAREAGGTPVRLPSNFSIPGFQIRRFTSSFLPAILHLTQRRAPPPA